MAQFKPMDSAEKLDRKGWLKYGDDNLYPQYLNEVVDSAPVHGALSVSVAAMIAGKEFETANTEFLALNPDKNRKDHAYDLKVQGGFFIEIIYDSDIEDRQFAKFEALPFENCRLAVAEDADRCEVITGIYFCKDWKDTRKNVPRFIPKYNWNKRTVEPRQSYWSFTKLTNSRCYPKPDYDRAMTWIEVEKQIGIYHMNHLLNGFFPAFIIHFMNGQVDEQEATSIKREFEKKLGAVEAGGVMATFNESDKVAPKIDAFPVTDADKQYQFLLDASTRQVMIGHRVTTPLLFGIRDGGGLGSNTDEMKTGLSIFENQVIEPYQRQICDAYIEIYEKAGVQLDLSIVKNSVLPEAEPAQTQQVKQEKKKPELSDDEANVLFSELDKIGIDPDPDWIEIDSFEDSDEVLQASTGTARPNAESSQDKMIDGKLFISRYRYSGEITPKSREFCSKMIGAGKLYRKEDLLALNDVVVNKGFGPRGADTYSVWLYKGGAACHHVWERVVYVSAKGLGIDVNSPKAKELAVDKAKDLGYNVRNNRLVNKRPIDMPNKGFLPKD